MTNPFISSEYKILPQVPISLDCANLLVEKFSEKNPRLKDRREIAKRLVKAMRNGEWQEQTGNTLKFDENGYVVDGGHRLEASVQAQKVFKWDVVLGVTREAAMHIDDGKRRSVGQSWAYATSGSYDDAARYSKVVPIVRLWLRFVNEWADMRFTREELFKFYQKHQSAILSVVNRPVYKYANQVGVRTAIAFYKTINREKATRLWERVAGMGENLKANSPELVLRNYLMNESEMWHPEKRQKMDFGATLFACSALERNEKPHEISYKFCW